MIAAAAITPRPRRRRCVLGETVRHERLQVGDRIERGQRMATNTASAISIFATTRIALSVAPAGAGDQRAGHDEGDEDAGRLTEPPACGPDRQSPAAASRSSRAPVKPTEYRPAHRDGAHHQACIPGSGSSRRPRRWFRPAPCSCRCRRCRRRASASPSRRRPAPRRQTMPATVKGTRSLSRPQADADADQGCRWIPTIAPMPSATVGTERRRPSSHGDLVDVLCAGPSLACRSPHRRSGTRRPSVAIAAGSYDSPSAMQRGKPTGAQSSGQRIAGVPASLRGIGTAATASQTLSASTVAATSCTQQTKAALRGDEAASRRCVREGPRVAGRRRMVLRESTASTGTRV